MFLRPFQSFLCLLYHDVLSTILTCISHLGSIERGIFKRLLRFLISTLSCVMLVCIFLHMSHNVRIHWNRLSVPWFGSLLFIACSLLGKLLGQALCLVESLEVVLHLFFSNLMFSLRHHVGIFIL